MKFFVPHAKDEATAEQVYQSTKDFAKMTTGWTVSNRRIYKIKYRHDGNSYVAEVGRPEPRTHEEVIIILETAPERGLPYLVCTPSRGVVRDMPILVGNREIDSIEDFEP